MSINPYQSPDTAGQAPERKSRPLQFRLFELLAVIAFIGLLIALLLPARRGAREASRRSSCSNNLKQIALALHNYQAEYGALPPAYTVDASGKPLHSWRTLILPFLEQKALYEQIDLSKPWDDPANDAALMTTIPVYQCPSAALTEGHTTYLAIVGPGCCFQSTEPRRLSEITDGTDSTLMVMEVDPKRAVHWMSPTDATEQEVLNFAAVDQLSHPGGAQAVFVSGDIRFLSAKTRPDVIRAHVSIAGEDDAVTRLEE